MVNTSLAEAVHGVHMTINNVVMKAMTVNKVVIAAALTPIVDSMLCCTRQNSLLCVILMRVEHLRVLFTGRPLIILPFLEKTVC